MDYFPQAISLFFEFLLVFVLFYMVIVFLVLPIGLKKSETITEVGHEKGAPANPQMARKLKITSVVAVICTIIFLCLKHTDVIVF